MKILAEDLFQTIFVEFCPAKILMNRDMNF